MDIGAVQNEMRLVLKEVLRLLLFDLAFKVKKH